MEAKIVPVTGLAGSGKSTLVHAVASRMGAHPGGPMACGIISSGDIARNLIKAVFATKTEVEKSIRSSYAGGFPDEDMLLRTVFLETEKFNGTSVRWIFWDGVPRTPGQVGWLIHKRVPVHAVIVLDATQEMRHARLRARDDSHSVEAQLIADSMQRDSMHLTVNALTMGSRYDVLRISTEDKTLDQTADMVYRMLMR